jgi:acyl-CoA hydrolase
MKVLLSDQLRLADYLRPNDHIVMSEAAGEPQTLAELVVAQRAELHRPRLFFGIGASTTFQPEHADHLDFSGTGAAMTYRPLIRAGVMSVVHQHFSDLPRLLRSGHLRCDVVMLQLSAPNERGEYSHGLSCDYLRAAMSQARLVIAEINEQLPQTPCAQPVLASDIDIALHTSRPPIECPAARIGELEQRIAAQVAEMIPDRATLQMGLGALPEALCSALKDHRDLGIHSGMLGDGYVDLMERGIVTNAYKEVDAGVSVTGVLIGTHKLYRHVHRQPGLRLHDADITHGAASLSRFKRFHSVNSALEVDLTGQVNAEAIGRDFLGTIGGQVDYVRAAVQSEGGRSVIALPSTARQTSRIVARLNGPVTTARSDVDVIVTEHGSAHLRGLPTRARVQAMIGIAAPEHRDTLSQQAQELGLL